MANLSLGLTALGFQVRRDFIVSVGDDGVPKILWLTLQPQPSDQAIVTAAVNAEAALTADDARRALLAGSALRTTILQRLSTASPQDISDFVDNQIGTGTAAQQMAGVKQLLKMLLIAISLDPRT